MAKIAQTMRATMAHAVSKLSMEHVSLFERATANSMSRLLDDILALPQDSLTRVLDLRSHELGNLEPHPLNARGLHVLKWLLARVIVDERRMANGWEAHPEHAIFARNGLLMRKLAHWSPGASQLPLTLAEAELIALASGYAEWPYPCARTDDGNNATSGLAVVGDYAHTFTDADDQYQLHIDVFMPNVKFMVFMERTTIDAGPFHFVLGSHSASESKARWLFERTRHLTQRGQVVGAFRHVNTSATAASSAGGWCSQTRPCLEAAYAWQQRDLAESYGFPRPMPVIVEPGTLIIADTSAFHFRGIGVAGHRRARMGRLVYGCGRTRKLLPPIAAIPRVPVLACANGTAIAGSCRVFYGPSRAQRHVHPRGTQSPRESATVRPSMLPDPG